MNKRSTGETLLVIFCYLAVYFVWGSTYLFIAYAVETIPASWILAFRFTISGGCLFIIAWAKGDLKNGLAAKEIFSAVLLGFLLLVMGNGLVTFAEKTVDSYKASLIMTTCPLLVALLSSLVYRKALAWPTIIGAFLGLGGVACVLYKGKSGTADSFNPALLLIFLGIFSWSFGSVFSKKLSVPKSPILSTAVQMLFTGLFASVAALISRGSPLPYFRQAAPLSLLSLVYLTVIGGATIVAYNYLLKKEPADRISSHALINPALATVLGLFVRREDPAPLLFLGLPLILGALALILYSEKIMEKVSKRIDGKNKLETGTFAGGE